jgi:hypothetical protein
MPERNKKLGRCVTEAEWLECSALYEDGYALDRMIEELDRIARRHQADSDLLLEARDQICWVRDKWIADWRRKAGWNEDGTVWIGLSHNSPRSAS